MVNRSYAVTPTEPIHSNVQWIPTGKIKIKKVDAETQQSKPQGQGSLEGAVYDLDQNSKKIDTLTTDKNGEAVSRELPIRNVYDPGDESTVRIYRCH